MRIVWDEAKRLTNLAKHGLNFADLATDFFSEAVVGPADKGRFIALGEWAGIRSQWSSGRWAPRPFR